MSGLYHEQVRHASSVAILLSIGNLALLLAHGCAKDIQPIAQPPSAIEAAVPSPSGARASDFTSPLQTLGALRLAVQAKDIERVAQTFVPDFRPVLRQWIADAGAETVLGFLRQGLDRIPPQIEEYVVVAHQPPYGVQWTVVTDNWPEALAAYQAATRDYGPTVEVFHASLPWRFEDGGWLITAW